MLNVTSGGAAAYSPGLRLQALGSTRIEAAVRTKAILWRFNTQEELDLHDYPGGHRHQWGRPAAPEGGTPEGRASGKRNSPSYTHCASRTAAELHHTRIHSLHSKGTAAAQ